MYDRLKQWNDFNQQIHKHIEEYTLEQYGSEKGTEQIDNFTTEDCWQNIQRYYNRRKSNVRGDKEKLRDVIKVAHYAQFIYDKLKIELKGGNIY